MKRFFCILVSAVTLCMILSACTDRTNVGNESSKISESNFLESAPDQASSGKPVTNLTIAEGQTFLKDGTNVTVRLVMRYGTYLTENDGIALGGGFAKENYVGSCELQVWNGETKLTAYAMGGESGVDTLYNKTGFSLQFDDYNGDGNPDFTVGQWCSSTENIYTLFSINQNAEILLLSEPYEIFTSDGKESGNDYSTLFKKTKEGFSVSIYSNATGENETAYYTFNSTTQKFTQK